MGATSKLDFRILLAEIEPGAGPRNSLARDTVTYHCRILLRNSCGTLGAAAQTLVAF